MGIAPCRTVCASWVATGRSRPSTSKRHAGRTSTRRQHSITRETPFSCDPGHVSRWRARFMPSSRQKSKSALRVLAVLIGVALLAYLVEKAGLANLLQNAKTIGWGMLAVLALAGVAHMVKTFAWRFVLLDEANKISVWRTLGLRLISEAIAQLGFVGLVFGESTRVALLGSEIPVATAVSSVTLDRGLFIVTGAVVTIIGIVLVILMAAISGGLRLFAVLSVLALLFLLSLAVLAVHKGWPLFSGTARALGRIPWFRSWINKQQAVTESAERQFLQFHRRVPRAFWASLILNFATHLFAVAEVYLILHLLGVHASFVGALIFESLTKLINVIGAVNPGNLGTYEGGNMVIGKLLGLGGAQGLTLGLCRRFRSIFWAAVGAICLAWYSRSNQPARPDQSAEIVTGANICN